MIKGFKRNLKVWNDYIKKRGKTCRCEMGKRGRSGVLVNKYPQKLLTRESLACVSQISSTWDASEDFIYSDFWTDLCSP
jgi:hypothetical protein